MFSIPPEPLTFFQILFAFILTTAITTSLSDRGVKNYTLQATITHKLLHTYFSQVSKMHLEVHSLTVSENTQDLVNLLEKQILNMHTEFEFECVESNGQNHR